MLSNPAGELMKQWIEDLEQKDFPRDELGRLEPMMHVVPREIFQVLTVRWSADQEIQESNADLIARRMEAGISGDHVIADLSPEEYAKALARRKVNPQ
jgi:hypothetical protein